MPYKYEYAYMKRPTEEADAPQPSLADIHVHRAILALPPPQRITFHWSGLG